MNSHHLRVLVAFFFVVGTMYQSGCRDKETTTRPSTTSAEQQAARAFCDGYVRANLNWTEIEFYKFLYAVTDEERLSIKKGLKLVEETATVSQLKGKDADVKEIQEQAVWISTNVVIWSWPWKKSDKVEYHALCQWVANELNVGQDDAHRDWLIRSQPTIVLERAICEKFWADTWDKLKPEQRRELLKKIDTGHTITNPDTIVAMGGTAALAALSTTVYFAGFAFYTTMTVTICTVASWFGITLPFAAYTGASSIVAFMSGPVGWAAIAVGTAISVAFLGKANSGKTAALIIQLHVSKAAKLQQAGVAVPNVPRRPW